METMLIFKLTETSQCKMLKYTMSLINMLLSLGPAGFCEMHNNPVAVQNFSLSAISDE
jgi:hypothetical protein